MAQNALTVTAPNPTPPTNTSSIGMTAPDPGTFLAAAYYSSVGGVNDIHYPYGGPGVTPVSTAPYFDDGLTNTPIFLTLNETGGVHGTTVAAPATVTAFAAAHAVVADSTGLSTATPEALGTEVVVTQTYGTGVLNPMGTSQNRSFSCLGNYTNSPNSQHASSLSSTTVLTPTTSAASGASNVSGIGTTLLTVTGTNFNRSSVVNISGIAQPTNYVSATSLTVTNALKKTSSGNLPVTVTNTNFGTTSTPATNWVFT